MIAKCLKLLFFLFISFSLSGKELSNSCLTRARELFSSKIDIDLLIYEKKLSQYFEEYQRFEEKKLPLMSRSLEGLMAYDDFIRMAIGEKRLSISERWKRLKKIYKSRGQISQDSLDDAVLSMYFLDKSPLWTFTKKERVYISKRIAMSSLFKKVYLDSFGEDFSHFQENAINKYGIKFFRLIVNLAALSLQWPPLFLPKVGLIKMSNQLLDKILREGISNENLKIFDKALKAETQGVLFSTLTQKANYEILKKYYYYGLLIYGIFYFDDIDLERNEEILKNFEKELDSTLALSPLPKSQVNNNFFCREIYDCLHKQLSLNEFYGQETLMECRRFFDENSKCLLDGKYFLFK